MKRSSAVWMHLGSLPGPFGIGVMGQEAREFIDLLSDAKVRYWQLLPLLQPEDRSPYRPRSCYAGCGWFIDPRALETWGLLEREELAAFRYYEDPYLIDYQFVIPNSDRLLGLAFSRLQTQQLDQVRQFTQAEPWLKDYAAFSLLYRDFDGQPWWEWDDERLKRHDPVAVEAYIEQNRGFFDYICFGQWAFARQWGDLSAYAANRGVELIGDLPLYPAYNSADVWAHPERFQLNADGSPQAIRSTPGQLPAHQQRRGTTLYNWEEEERRGFPFWKERIGFASSRYRVLRLNQFRDVYRCLAIPYGADDPGEGWWQDGPGNRLFAAVEQSLSGPLQLIGDDDGIAPGAAGLPTGQATWPCYGLRLLQSGFNDGPASGQLPHQCAGSVCACSSTADSNTLLGWIWEADEARRQYALNYVGFPEGWDWGGGGPQSSFVRSCLRSLWQSAADLVCVSVQDLCGFGADTRVNDPLHPEKVWRFRLSPAAKEGIDGAFIRHLNETFDRCT
ncbi:hypothetical protein HCH52_09430 [Oscillospiraceae bacterium HV4-5-C5C]|nr:hypothetical protein [Oscillospiraceae bacterium HV4-5-C5C]